LTLLPPFTIIVVPPLPPDGVNSSSSPSSSPFQSVSHLLVRKLKTSTAATKPSRFRPPIIKILPSLRLQSCPDCTGITRLRRVIKHPEGESGIAGQRNVIIESRNLINTIQCQRLPPQRKQRGINRMMYSRESPHFGCRPRQ